MNSVSILYKNKLHKIFIILFYHYAVFYSFPSQGDSWKFMIYIYKFLQFFFLCKIRFGEFSTDSCSLCGVNFSVSIFFLCDTRLSNHILTLEMHKDSKVSALYTHVMGLKDCFRLIFVFKARIISPVRFLIYNVLYVT